MALTEERIHPAFDIARVSRSDFELFIRLDRRRVRSAPPGGHKDAQSHIKRPAPRFRASGCDNASDWRAAEIRSPDRRSPAPPRQLLDMVKAGQLQVPAIPPHANDPHSIIWDASDTFAVNPDVIDRRAFTGQMAGVAQVVNRLSATASRITLV